MLRPHKYEKPETTILHVSAYMLSQLQANGAMPLEELRERVHNALPQGVDTRFQPSLSFLFLLGLLDYELDEDTIIPIKIMAGINK